jgi:hypothetical protein
VQRPFSSLDRDAAAKRNRGSRFDTEATEDHTENLGEGMDLKKPLAPWQRVRKTVEK